jgi:hypothetical protein
MGIDAGIKKSQLPAFAKTAIAVSNATGLAATSVGDMMYRIASANPKIGITTKSMAGLVEQAGKLYVLAGNTGDYDSIARMYGAIVSNAIPLTHNGKSIPYTAAGGKSINEWALATIGHGDIKSGDLVSAMGTGILPLAKTFGLSLNEVGAALDVLTPAMNASAASTRLKTAFGMLGAPSQAAAQAYELFGGNATTAASTLRTKGLGGLLTYLSGMVSGRVTGTTFASAFYGGGLGATTGGTKGVGSGAGEYLRVLGYTPAQANIMEGTGGISAFGKMTPAQLQAVGFAKGTTGTEAVKSVQSALIGKMFGGGHTGAAIMQLLNEQGTYTSKLAAITTSEKPASYNAALKLAFAEPTVAFARLGQQFDNLAIKIGQDVTPDIVRFGNALLKVGNWFGKNKTALDALLGVAGAVVAGAAVVKTVSVVAKIVGGVKSVFGVITGTGSLTGALALNTGAVEANTIALGGGGVKNLVPAAGGSSVVRGLGALGLSTLAIGGAGLLGYLAAEYVNKHPISPKSPLGKINTTLTGNHGQYAPDMLIARANQLLLSPIPSHQATIGHDIGNWWDNVLNPKGKGGTKYPSGKITGLPGSPLPMFGTAGDPFSARAQSISRSMGVSLGAAGTFDASMSRAVGMKTASGQDRASVNAAAVLVAAGVQQKDAADHMHMSAAQITAAAKQEASTLEKLVTSANDQTTAATAQQSSSNNLNVATKALANAALDIAGMASNARTALLPSSIHNANNSGLKNAIARK